MGRAPKTDRRTASRANARRARTGKHGDTAEQRVRKALASDPTLTHEEVVKVARVSASTASKWVTALRLEALAEQRRAAQ
jgi:hypothetical protein